MQPTHHRQIRSYVPYLIAVVGAILVRAWPELKIGPVPVGNDASTSYVTAITTYHTGLVASLKSFNLLYYLFSLTQYLHTDPLLTIKVFGVGLYVAYLTSFYFLFRDSFRLRPLFALFGTILFGLQLATLRLSWDLYRNELGLTFAFICLWQLVLLLRDRRWWRIVPIVLAAGLTYGTHQLASFSLVLVVISGGLITLINHWWGKQVTFIGVLLMGIIWLFLAPHIHIGSLELWTQMAPSTANVLLPLNLAWLIFFPALALLAVVGICTTWYPALLASFLLLGLNSFSSVIFRTQGFFLWDRWMYLFAIPLTIYALLGILWLGTGWIRPVRWIIYLVAAGLLLYPATQFYLPKKTLYTSSVNSAVFSLFPASMMTNSFVANLYERDLSLNLESCMSVFNQKYTNTTPILVDPRYQIIATYFAPRIAGHTTTNMSDIPPRTAYYYLTYVVTPQEHLTAAPGYPAGCPVYQGISPS